MTGNASGSGPFLSLSSDVPEGSSSGQSDVPTSDLPTHQSLTTEPLHTEALSSDEPDYTEIEQALNVVGHANHTYLLGIHPGSSPQGQKHASAISPSKVSNLRAWVKSMNTDRNCYIVSNDVRVGSHRTTPSKIHVSAVTMLLLDLDTTRPKGFGDFPATHDEFDATRECAEALIGQLLDRGILSVKPIMVCSGNGVQIWICIPRIAVWDHNREDIQAAMKRFHAQVRRVFEEDETENTPCTLDSTFSLQQPMRLPGTINRKIHTNEFRQPRRAFFLSEPVRREDEAVRAFLLEPAPSLLVPRVEMPLLPGNTPLPPHIELWIRTQHLSPKTNRGKPDRSAGVINIARELFRRGYDAQVVEATMRRACQAWRIEPAREKRLVTGTLTELSLIDERPDRESLLIDACLQEISTRPFKGKGAPNQQKVLMTLYQAAKRAHSLNLAVALRRFQKQWSFASTSTPRNIVRHLESKGYLSILDRGAAQRTARYQLYPERLLGSTYFSFTTDTLYRPRPVDDARVLHGNKDKDAWSLQSAHSQNSIVERPCSTVSGISNSAEMTDASNTEYLFTTSSFGGSAERVWRALKGQELRQADIVRATNLCRATVKRATDQLRLVGLIEATGYGNRMTAVIDADLKALADHYGTLARADITSQRILRDQRQHADRQSAWHPTTQASVKQAKVPRVSDTLSVHDQTCEAVAA